MAVGFLLALQNAQCIPLLHSLVVLQILFSPNSFDFFDEFDYGAIGYAIFFTEEVDFNFETYLPAPMTVLAPYVQPCSSRKFMFK
jgi:hypothetical protein